MTELRTRTKKTFFFIVKIQSESNGCVAVAVRHITVVQFWAFPQLALETYTLQEGDKEEEVLSQESQKKKPRAELITNVSI